MFDNLLVRQRFFVVVVVIDAILPFCLIVQIEKPFHSFLQQINALKEVLLIQFLTSNIYNVKTREKKVENCVNIPTIIDFSIRIESIKHK
uniref:Secreted protein n=1 Tax=Romanomermis culicivorax TaxID=13658 RepID=A0A915JN67_ROMCU